MPLVAFKDKHSNIDQFTRAATIVFDSRFDTSIYGDQYESHSAFCVTLFAYTAYFVGCGQQKSLFHTDLTPYENLVVSIL